MFDISANSPGPNYGAFEHFIGQFGQLIVFRLVHTMRVHLFEIGGDGELCIGVAACAVHIATPSTPQKLSA